MNEVMLQAFHWYSPGDGSYWRSLASRAEEMAAAGFTLLWLPPAYKGEQGALDSGYGVYDMYDLGEFDQKGGVRTKYGTREEYQQAVAALQRAGMRVLADAVLDHRSGGDGLEEVLATPYSQQDRRVPLGPERVIRCYTEFSFPGRAGAYSDFRWTKEHFAAVDFDANEPAAHGRFYLLHGRSLSPGEDGGSARLFGCLPYCANPEVQAQTRRWGQWTLDFTGVDGFRIVTSRHAAPDFLPCWLEGLSTRQGGKPLVLGSFWQGDLDGLLHYADLLKGEVPLFDLPLHYNLHAASRSGGRYDMRRIFDRTLVRERPEIAVTFVDNHDTQPLGFMESCVDSWFKPLAYALVLLRAEGLPCVFEPDYHGARYVGRGYDGLEHAVNLPSHRYLLDRFLWARRHYGHGVQEDYFDHCNRIGWTRLGDPGHAGAMAVLLSDGMGGSKWMDVKRPGAVFYDICGHDRDCVIANEEGWAEFHCPGGSLSVWVERYEGAPLYGAI